MVHWKQDADGNSIKNVLDTNIYEVEYPWGDMTELTGRVDVCPVNEYLSWEAFVDHRKNHSSSFQRGRNP